MHRDGSQLNKFQSFDWQAQAHGAQERGSQDDDGAYQDEDQGQSGNSATCVGSSSQRLLKHSISIVVDLAKADAGQQQQLQLAKSAGLSSCGSSGNSNDETTTSDIGDDNDQSRRRRRKRVSEEDGSGGGGSEATEEEEEDEDDDGLERCLISGLARRVVLVDEADKKFLRNRARSAEPQMLRMHLAGLWQAERSPSPSDWLAAAAQRPPISPTKPGDSGARSSPATGSSGTIVAAATATNATSSFQYHSSSSSPQPPNLISSAIHHDHQHNHPAKRAHEQQQRRRSPPPGDQMSPSGPITSSNGNVAGLRPRLSLVSALATSPLTPQPMARSRLSSTSGGGGGELAESGRLSMRRNTHHHVNFTAVATDYNKQRVSSAQNATSSNDQLSRRTSGQPRASSISSESATTGRTTRSPSFAAGQQHSSHSPIKTPHQFSQQLNASSSHNTSQVLSRLSPLSQHNWPAQHRRQSLQFCLLSGLTSRGAGLETGRSLTEEELRGEREFNEQVRNTARSPPDFAAQHIFSQLNPITPANNNTTNQQRAQQHQTILRRVSLNRSCSPAELGSYASGRLNQPTGVCGGGGSAELKSEWQKSCERLTALNFKPQQSPLLAASSQIASNQSGGNSCKSRRRVSFGCIDPIPTQHWSDTATPTSSFARKSDLDPNLGSDSEATLTFMKHHYKRASICLASAQAAHQATNLSGGILRNLQKAPLSSTKADDQMADSHSKPTKTMATKHDVNDDDDDNQPNHKSKRDVSDQMPASDDANGGQGGGQPKKDDGGGQWPSQSVTGMGTTSDSSTATVSNSCSSPSSSAERDNSRVESIMANAKLRQEEFARLLEEHEQIVIEINRFETKISNAAATATTATSATEAAPAVVSTTTPTSQR